MMNLNFFRILIAIKICCICSAELPKAFREKELLVDDQTIASSAFMTRYYQDMMILQKGKTVWEPTIQFINSAHKRISMQYEYHDRGCRLGDAADWIMFYNSDRNEILIYFTGSHTFSDTRQMMKTDIVAFEYDYGVFGLHKGIVEMTKSSQPVFEAAFWNLARDTEKLTKDDLPTVFIMGFSAGGANAQVRMLNLQNNWSDWTKDERYSKLPIVIVSVGAPPFVVSGQGAQSKSLPDHDTFKVYNVDNDEDFVPLFATSSRFGFGGFKKFSRFAGQDNVTLNTGESEGRVDFAKRWLGPGHSIFLYAKLLMDPQLILVSRWVIR